MTLLTTSETAALLAMSPRSFRAHRRGLYGAGFPRPLALPGARPRWSADAVQSWLARRAGLLQVSTAPADATAWAATLDSRAAAMGAV